jgi:hypothetical protein
MTQHQLSHDLRSEHQAYNNFQSISNSQQILDDRELVGSKGDSLRKAPRSSVIYMEVDYV